MTGPRGDMTQPVDDLGQKIERRKEPQRPPVEIRPGVFQGPDGKLYTQIEPPPLPLPDVIFWTDAMERA